MSAHKLTKLELAVKAAADGAWEQSHQIVQNIDHPLANWLHAVLHKMEGDEGNSRYWYACSQGRRYEDFLDIKQELAEILQQLKRSSQSPV